MSKTKNENSASAGFFQFPRALFTSPKYQSLSAEAKCLYIFMLDRLSVSHKNGWIDFNAGELAQGKSMEALTQEFYDFVLSVASGEKTKSERMDKRDLAIFKDGVTL